MKKEATLTPEEARREAERLRQEAEVKRRRMSAIENGSPVVVPGVVTGKQ